MIARLPVLTLVRLWAALVLAAVGLQAAQPIHAPLESRHGSAFSAATFEVALAPERRAEAQQVLPVLLPQHPRSAPLPAATASFTPDLPRRPDSTGPPAREILARQPAPRGPPHA